MLNKMNKKRLMKELLALITACSLALPVAGCSRKGSKLLKEDTSEVADDYDDELSEEEEMERLRMNMIINDYITDEYSDSSDDESCLVTNNIILDKIYLEDNSVIYFVMGELAEAYGMTIEGSKYAVIDSDNFGIYYGLFKVDENEEVVDSHFAQNEEEIENYFTQKAINNMTEERYMELDCLLGEFAVWMFDADYAIESLYLNPYINGDYANVYDSKEGHFVYQTKDEKRYNGEMTAPSINALKKSLNKK